MKVKVKVNVKKVKLKLRSMSKLNEVKMKEKLSKGQIRCKSN